MFRALRPVGEPEPGPSAIAAWEIPHGFDRVWYNSGTSALAAVLSDIAARSNATMPEVLLPAYTCPDVLSAVEFARAKAVLVDLQPGRPWMAIDELERSDKETALVTLCVGAGMGTATIIERV